MLEAARAQIPEGATPTLHTLLQTGDLTEVLLGQEARARLFVLGSNRRPVNARKLRLDHTVESAVRNLRQPVMVMGNRPFSAPDNFVIAWDGSATAERAVQVVARSPLARGLPALLVSVGDSSARQQASLRGAQELLQDAGFSVNTRTLPGLPEEAIPALLDTLGQTLLVLGAYGHSRIRQLIVGSTTTALLRLCNTPVVVLR